MSYLLEADLVADLRQGGCALCRAAGRTGRDYLRSLMTSDINDWRVRERVTRSGGLCREHVLTAVEVARETGDPLGLALLAELLLDACAARLRRERVGPRSWTPRSRARRFRASRPWVGGGPWWRRLVPPCPACAAEAVVVDGYAELLMAPGSQAGQALRTGDRGLCLPHALGALEVARSRAEAKVAVEAWERQARRLRRLAELLAARQAHDRRHEPPGEETAVWDLLGPWIAGGRPPPPGRPQRGW